MNEWMNVVNAYSKFLSLSFISSIMFNFNVQI